MRSVVKTRPGVNTIRPSYSNEEMDKMMDKFIAKFELPTQKELDVLTLEKRHELLNSLDLIANKDLTHEEKMCIAIYTMAI